MERLDFALGISLVRLVRGEAMAKRPLLANANPTDHIEEVDTDYLPCN
ncbi:hypothetical protein [Cylindrospermum stagnale]|nr:hypothetical protein [Cylindrospermum stagnale]